VKQAAAGAMAVSPSRHSLEQVLDRLLQPFLPRAALAAAASNWGPSRRSVKTSPSQATKPLICMRRSRM